MRKPELSTAAQNALPSGIRRMFELAKNYDDAINLTLGEPGYPAPDHVIEAAIKGMLAPEFKEVIIDADFDFFIK